MSAPHLGAAFDDNAGTKAGWLSKREQVSGSLMSWKKRWVVLTPDYFRVYKTPKEATRPEEHLEVLQIQTNTLTGAETTFTDHKHSFKLLAKTVADIAAFAEDAKTKDEWMNAVKKAIEESARREEIKKKEAEEAEAKKKAAAAVSASSPRPSTTWVSVTPRGMQSSGHHPAPIVDPKVAEEKAELLRQQEEMLARLAALRGDNEVKPDKTAAAKDEDDDDDDDDEDDDDDDDE